MWAMDDADWLAAQFESSRSRLRAVAYRMLGSRTEADDAVQETWLRLGGTDASRIDNLGGWLTTVVARVCLDRLRTRRSRREDLTGAQPVDDLAGAVDDYDPAHQALMAESVGAALLVVLDSLAPAERVAFVLHDVFAVPFDEIATVVDRSPDAARQLASRARRRVQGTAPTGDLDLVRQRDVVDAFLRAARGGDFEALLRLLDPDVVLRPDAAAVRMGSLREISGAEAVATALSGGARAAQLAIVDGVAALVWAPGGQTRGVIEFTIADDRIVAINVTGDAERIGSLDIVTLDR
jgi:RNA polymerase sigma-70 factor (ECF subfamily)